MLSIFNLSGGTAQSGRSHCSIQAEPLLNFAGRADFAERRTHFLDNIENQQLYQVLIKVDRLTLHIAFMKVQGYSTREIASYLRITEKAVYRRLDRLKEKIQKIFE